jgi:hypothetical protein
MKTDIFRNESGSEHSKQCVGLILKEYLMKYTKQIFAVLILSSIIAEAAQMRLHRKAVHGPEHIELYHTDEEGFSVIDQGNKRRIPAYQLEGDLRKMDHATLRTFLSQDGYIRVKKFEEGEYKLTPYTRGLGGGPIAGAIGYWLVKAGSYGTMAAGVTALTITTAGTGTALLTGGAATAVGATITAGAGTAAVAGVTAASGAGVVAGALTTAGLGTAAGTATVGAAVAAPGGILGLFAIIEGSAATVGGALLACPFLP